MDGLVISKVQKGARQIAWSRQCRPVSHGRQPVARHLGFQHKKGASLWL